MDWNFKLFIQRYSPLELNCLFLISRTHQSKSSVQNHDQLIVLQVHPLVKLSHSKSAIVKIAIPQIYFLLRWRQEEVSEFREELVQILVLVVSRVLLY